MYTCKSRLYITYKIVSIYLSNHKASMHPGPLALDHDFFFAKPSDRERDRDRDRDRDRGDRDRDRRR